MACARQSLGALSDNLSQEAFTSECGLHRTDIAGLERGIRNPTATVMRQIAVALEVEPGMLFEQRRSKRSLSEWGKKVSERRVRIRLATSDAVEGG